MAVLISQKEKADIKVKVLMQNLIHLDCVFSFFHRA